MNSAPFIFFGILLGLAGSWWGVIVAPAFVLGTESTALARETGQHYPPTRPGMALQGAEIYRSEGCNACHSQWVRPSELGFDMRRGWGPRRTVSSDYLRDDPVLLGSMRVGPDLANIGLRMGAGDTNAQPAMVAAHLKHLYQPRSATLTPAEGGGREPRSVMPPYPYLFEKRPIRGTPAPDALKLTGEYAPEPGYEVVPTERAYALVSYLLSLQSSVSLASAPILRPSTNDVANGTNTVDAASATSPAASGTNTASPTQAAP